MKTIIKLFPLMLFFVFLSLLIINCKTTRVKINKEASIANESKTRLKVNFDEDFDKFYARFHSDSIFQMSRIVFPLNGIHIDGFEETKWDKKNWILIKTKYYDVDTTQFKVKYNKTSKTFTQKAWIENSGFSSECRFEIISKKWYLVYFLDNNN